MASLSSPLAPPALPAAQAQPQAGLVNIERNLEAQKEQNVKQTQEISGLRTTVEALRTETATLNNGIGSVSNLIQQDAAVEKQQEQQEAVRESRLLETKVRMGKESQLEQSITNALAAPVQALQPKISNIFDRIGSALFTLFAGWLTNQGIEALKASAEGNKTKLEQIRDRVLNAFGDVIKVFTAIRTGFGLIIKTITTLAGRIAGFVTKLAPGTHKSFNQCCSRCSSSNKYFWWSKKTWWWRRRSRNFWFCCGSHRVFYERKKWGICRCCDGCIDCAWTRKNY